MDLRVHFSEKALNDFQLIDEAISGDEKAYARLMKKYRKPVFHTVLRMVRNTDDAEDLTIETFGKAFKNLSKFQKSYTFSAWLFRIATNNCIDFIRKRKLKTLSVHAAQTLKDGRSIRVDIRDDGLSPHDKTIRNQKIKIIREFVKLLPTKYQKLVKLRYFQELSYKEIAREVDLPLGTIKAQLHRAKNLLYDLVKKSKDVI